MRTMTRRAALLGLAGSLAALTGRARAEVDRPRTEALFMCPCDRCVGKWLPNCANPNCSGAVELRRDLREMEAEGLSDDQIVEAVVAKLGAEVVADPSQRVDKGSWLVTALYGVPLAGLIVGGGLLALAGRRAAARNAAEARATRDATPAAPATSEADDQLVAQALSELDR